MRMLIGLLYATVYMVAQPFSVHIKKVDGMMQEFLIELEPGKCYFEVLLQNKYSFDFGECEVKDKNTCTLKHGSVLQFYKISD